MDGIESFKCGKLPHMPSSLGKDMLKGNPNWDRGLCGKDGMAGQDISSSPVCCVRVIIPGYAPMPTAT